MALPALFDTRRGARLCALALVAVCAAAATFGAFAQTPRQRGWLWQNPLPQGNAIYAVRFAPDKLAGWAVGADGVILHTKDGGYRWEEQRSNTPVPLYGLFVKDQKTAIAVGSRGQALLTQNGGRRWLVRETGVK